MTNEKRAELLVQKYGFDFDEISKDEIRNLIEQEIECFQEGSSEYIRVLCGYLFCLGNIADVPLLEKAKHGINFDVGCMIDQEWIGSLKNGGAESESIRSRNEIIDSFVAYYKDFTADADDGDEWGGSMFSTSLFDD